MLQTNKQMQWPNELTENKLTNKQSNKQTFNLAEQMALTTSSMYLVRFKELRSATSLSLFCSVRELSFFTKTLFFFTELSSVLKKESGGWCAETGRLLALALSRCGRVLRMLKIEILEIKPKESTAII